MDGLAAQNAEDRGEILKPAENPDISIVTVGYNSRAALATCLSAVFGAGVKVRLEVIVVDNNSRDGTIDFVRESFPKAHVIENSENLGYSRAVNQGIARARGRYILILNPDVRPLDQSIDNLFRFMEAHPDAGMAGARLVNEDGSVQHSCRRFYTLWTLLLRRTFLGKIFRRSRAIDRYLMLDFDHEESRLVDWIMGACMMVRKQALADVGVMDERFFLYFEDVDWCYRMWRRGWRIYYVADSVMRHTHARASARPGLTRHMFMHLVSMVRFYEKWGRTLYAVKRYRQIMLKALFLISDLAAINGSFALAYMLRSSLTGVLDKPMFGAGVYANFVAFANIVLVLSFAFFGLYGSRSGQESGPDLLLRALKATVVAAVILMASTFLTYQTVYSRVLVGTFSLLVVVLATVFRVLLRRLHRCVQAGRFNLRRVVIVGTGELAQRLSTRLAAQSRLGYDTVGLVDAGEGRSGTTRVPLMGKLSELPRLIEDQRIDEVIFAAPELSNEEIADFLLEARRSAVDVKMISGLSSILTQRARVEEFLDFPVLSFEREALLRAGAGVKRLLDIVFAAPLVAIWAPALAIAALITGVGRGSPPLATVPRVGLGGRRFAMYVLAEDPGDSRLRSFVIARGLSAFPALLNVLRGEMSFVGPRPALPDEIERYGPKEQVRFDARPGIVGPSRISLPGELPSAKNRTVLDVYYVQNWSLAGDMRMLLRAAAKALGGQCGP